MQSFMITLLACSCTMSALSLFYISAMPLLAKRYSAKGRYYAWLVIVAGLIIPFRPQFDTAFVKVDMSAETVPVVQIGNGAPILFPVPAAAQSHTLPGVAWWHIAAAIWLIGMVAFLACHIIKHVRFMNMVERWSEETTDEQTLSLLKKVKEELGISRPIKLCICPCAGSPMLIGFGSPGILLPKADFAKDELIFILKHELVHYSRKDLLYKCLLLIAMAIHWFNPAIYLMAKVINVLCEISCDAEVVKNTNVNTRRHYSETIIGVVRYQSKMQTSLSTNFYGGKKGMKNRIFSIMDSGKKRVGIAVISAATLLTLGSGATLIVNASPAATQKEDSFTAADAYGLAKDDNTGAGAQALMPGADLSEGAVYSASVETNKGGHVDLGDFDSKEKAYGAMKQYYSEQISSGNMTQQEADKLLASASQQWDGWAETVTE